MKSQQILPTLVFFVALTVPFGLFAQDHEGIELIGNLRLPNTTDISGAYLKDGFLYSAYGTNTLMVVDVRDASHPHWFCELEIEAPDSFFYFDHYIMSLNDTLVILTDGVRMCFIDVSQPGNPEYIGGSRPPRDIIWAAYNGLIFVSDYLPRTISIWRVEADLSFRQLSEYQLEGKLSSVACSGNTLALTYGIPDWNWGVAGMQIVDISDPSNPEAIYSLYGKSSYGVSLTDVYCVVFQNYTMNNILEYQVIDIHDRDAIRVTGTFNSQVGAPRVYFSGSSAWIETMHGFNIIDLTEIENPAITDSIIFPMNSPGYDSRMGHWVLEVQDSLLFLGQGSPYGPNARGGMGVYDISNLDSVGMVGCFTRSRQAVGLTWHDNLLVAVRHEDAVVLVDVLDPSVPRELSQIYIPEVTNVAFASGNKMLAHSDLWGVLIYDIANPAAPIEIGRGGQDSCYTRTVFSPNGETAYQRVILDGPLGLHEIDLSDPNHIQEVGFLSDQRHHDVTALEMGNSVVFEIGAELAAFDIERPGDPTLISSIQLPTLNYSPVYRNSQLLTMDRRKWIIKYDVSLPAHIERIMHWSIYTRTQIVNNEGGMRGMQFNDDGDFLGVADGSAGVRLFHVGNLDHAWETGYYDTPGEAYSASFGSSGNQGNLIFVADGDALLILDASEALDITDQKPVIPGRFSFTIFPNPSNGQARLEFNLPYASSVNFELINGQGRSVRQMNIGHLKEGLNRQALDLNDITNGVYFVRVNTGITVEMRKIVLLK